MDKRTRDKMSQPDNRSCLNCDYGWLCESDCGRVCTNAASDICTETTDVRDNEACGHWEKQTALTKKRNNRIAKLWEGDNVTV